MNANESSQEKRVPTGTLDNPVLAQQLLDAFDQLQGVHPGFRPAHAKGLMCAGTFAPSAEAAMSPNFLFDELGPRLAKEPVKLGIFVQLAEAGDDVADASTTWPAGRAEIPFGTVTLTTRVDDQKAERRKIIFDPVPRVDGIDSSGDPLTQVRADIYLLSGRRRRAALASAGAPPS